MTWFTALSRSTSSELAKGNPEKAIQLVINNPTSFDLRVCFIHSHSILHTGDDGGLRLPRAQDENFSSLCPSLVCCRGTPDLCHSPLRTHLR